MTKSTQFALLLSLATAGVIAACSCANAPESPGGQGQSIDAQAEVGAAGSDGGDFVTVSPPGSPFRFPDTPVGRALSENLALQLRTDSESVGLLSSSVAYLRANASEVTQALLAVYDQLPEEQYLARWYVVNTLTSLEAPEAAGAFRSIVLRDVPPERWADAEGHASSVAEEALLRRRAIEGLKPLALAGSPEAADTLRRAMSSPLASVRGAAARAYLAAGRRSPARFDEVRALLPVAEHGALERRRATGEDFLVPTPEPPAPGAPASPVAPPRTP